MDKLLKHALDDDAVNFSDRFKEKMQDYYDDAKTDITRQVVADMSGLEVSEVMKFRPADDVKKMLKKVQFKDAFTLKDDIAGPLVKSGMIVANKGKGTYSITDKGKNFLESEDDGEKCPEGKKW